MLVLGVACGLSLALLFIILPFMPFNSARIWLAFSMLIPQKSGTR